MPQAHRPSSFSDTSAADSANAARSRIEQRCLHATLADHCRNAIECKAFTDAAQVYLNPANFKSNRPRLMVQDQFVTAHTRPNIGDFIWVRLTTLSPQEPPHPGQWTGSDIKRAFGFAV